MLRTVSAKTELAMPTNSWRLDVSQAGGPSEDPCSHRGCAESPAASGDVGPQGYGAALAAVRVLGELFLTGFLGT